MRTVAILPVRLYQLLVSPLLPANTCKYHPSCSEYAVLAIRKHGVLRGIALAAWRLLRCNPWSHGGVVDRRADDSRADRARAVDGAPDPLDAVAPGARAGDEGDPAEVQGRPP